MKVTLYGGPADGLELEIPDYVDREGNDWTNLNTIVVPHSAAGRLVYQRDASYQGNTSGEFTFRGIEAR